MPSHAADQRLAILGGPSVRLSPWPKWPRVDDATRARVLEVLDSGRWSISGKYNGTTLFERRFAEAFARFNGAAHCTPTSSGSTALTIALKALGVGHGHEVLVPGLAWVACPVSVIECGARPVLVDLDPVSLCMSAEAARAAITPKTKAIMLVHLHCTVADLDAFEALSEETGIPLLEDASQAHGAVWGGRRVGSVGRVGVFSMHESKVLAAGEGGAAITDDPLLQDRMQQLRANGRRYAEEARLGFPRLELGGDVLGRNGAMSELHAAVLLGGLARLDEENALRDTNAEALCEALAEVEGCSTPPRHPRVDRRTWFRFRIRLDLERFSGLSAGRVQAALSAELNTMVGPAGSLLTEGGLYDPALATELAPAERAGLRAFELPLAREASGCNITLPHHVLMGTVDDALDVCRALKKIRCNSGHFID